MPADCEMTIGERRKYLKRMDRRYKQADWTGRGVLLTEMEAVTGMHRKSLIRLLGQESLERRVRTRQRGRVYGVELEDALRVVWESLDYVCAERLTPCLLGTARQLARFGELGLDAELEGQLGRVSEATVARLLSRFAQDTPRLPRRGPEEANRLARSIPTGRIDWRTAEAGHFEVDLVHHSGESSAGEYIHTLQMVDVATGWSERIGVLGRSARAMEEAFRILARLPFRVVHLHPDNGSEFLNNHLVRFFGSEVVGRGLSRSRPYHKNDNRFVEQKNYSLVRAYLGYRRMDSAWQLHALNHLYDRMWLYYNLFQPVMHLVSKEAEEGSHIKRKWDEARTPYQRLLGTGSLDDEQRGRLVGLYEATNPRKLRAEIHTTIESLWDEPALDGVESCSEAERELQALAA